MSEIFDTNLSLEDQTLSLEDCDELLKFPYHQYANNIKTEEIDDDFPELGPIGDLELNSEVGENLFAENTSKDEDYSNIVEVKARATSVNQDLRKKLALSCNILFAAEEKNRTKKKKLEAVKKETQIFQNRYEGKIRRYKPISLFAAPYFRDVNDRHPPDNEDTIAKFKNCDVTAYFQLPRPWVKLELDKLMEGVLESATKTLVKPLKERHQHYRERLKNLVGFERKKVKCLLREVNEKIKKERKRPPEEIISIAKDRIDWMEVAVTSLQGTRSDDECEAMWNNYASIFISKLPFSREEDARLAQLVKEYNGRNWDAIAEKMQTGRSAVQCLERYQTSLNKALIKKYWTPEEDKHLVEVVELHRIGKFIPWNKVVSYMEGRERHQIINRYERTVNKELKRTKWTKEEDAMLYACVGKFGPHWTKMMEFFPGRNTYTLRERYVNILDPNLKFVQWTKREDLKLISLVKKYGFGKWSKISKEMNGRTDNSCLIRARCLGINKQKTNENGESSDGSRFDTKNLKLSSARRMRWRFNSKVNVQTAARKTLLEAFGKINFTQEENINLETLNLSSISITALRELHAELKKNERSSNEINWKPRYLSLDGVNKREFTRPSKKRKTETTEEEESEELKEEIDEDLHCNEDEKELDAPEKVWLQEILQAKMKEEANLIHMPAYTKCYNYSSKESAECSIYETYLKQKMACSLTQNEEEDVSFVLRGVDYNVSLADIVSHFIQPPVSENNPAMILPPNWTTLTGMDIMESTKNNLKKATNFVDHNKSYFSYLVGNTNNRPKCIKCCNAENAKTCKETFDVVVNAMKSSLIIPDEEMKQAAMVETRQSAVQDNDCCCDELANSIDAVHLLTCRFISLFMWPLLLGTSNLTAKQNELVVTKRHKLEYKDFEIPRKSPENSKRKYKKNTKNKIKEEVQNVPPSNSTLRRSRRSCVLQKNSARFTYDTTEDDSIVDNTLQTN